MGSKYVDREEILATDVYGEDGIIQWDTYDCGLKWGELCAHVIKWGGGGDIPSTNSAGKRVCDIYTYIFSGRWHQASVAV